MRTEKEIRNEIDRLRLGIKVRQSFCKDISTDKESKELYRSEILDFINDIKRLEWVLEI